MTDTIIHLDTLNPIEFFGVNNAKLNLLKKRFPLLKILSRGTQIKLSGAAEYVEEAKEKIDKVLADPKNANNANAWYYKGKVYAGLALQDSAGTLAYDAQKEAYDAFVKYQQLDPKNILAAD